MSNVRNIKSGKRNNTAPAPAGKVMNTNQLNHFRAIELGARKFVNEDLPAAQAELKQAEQVYQTAIAKVNEIQSAYKGVSVLVQRELAEIGISPQQYAEQMQLAFPKDFNINPAAPAAPEAPAAAVEQSTEQE